MRWGRFLRTARTVLLAQVLTGSILGLCARLAMRVVALTDETPGTAFTVGGTLGILIAFIVLSTPATLVYLLVRRFLPGATVVKGLTFGFLELVVVGIRFLSGGEVQAIGVPALNVVLFGGLFLLHGAVLVTMVHRLEPRGQRSRGQPGGTEPVPVAASPSTR